ncbi:hypothetical protein LINPERHAP1_LOCUS7866, partial [Linum perenne]
STTAAAVLRPLPQSSSSSLLFFPFHFLQIPTPKFCRRLPTCSDLLPTSTPDSASCRLTCSQLQLLILSLADLLRPPPDFNFRFPPLMSLHPPPTVQNSPRSRSRYLDLDFEQR